MISCDVMEEKAAMKPAPARRDTFDSGARSRDRSRKRSDRSRSRTRYSRDREVTPSRGNSPGRHCEARTPRRRDRNSSARYRRGRDSPYSSCDDAQNGALGKILMRLNQLEGRLSTSVVSPPTIDTERRTPLLPLGAKNISTKMVEQVIFFSSFDPNLHDFDLWCHEVDRARVINKWDDRECLGRIGSCLKGDASTWLNDWYIIRSLCYNSSGYTTFAEYARKSLMRLNIVTGLSDELRTAIVIRGISDPQVKAAATNAKLQSKDLVEFLSAYVKPKRESKFSNNFNNARPSQVGSFNSRRREMSKSGVSCFICGRTDHKKGRILSLPQ
ncbi:hypothetical protein ACJJTC_000949 [Scirpophaga incertulas]